MANKKVPMRKCVVTDEMKPKKEMVRVVRSKDKDVFIDETGKKNGRGAYISLDKTVAEEAKEKDVLSSALNTDVSTEFYDELLEHVDYRIARLEIMRQNEQ